MAKPIYIYTGTEWVPVGPQIGNIAYNWIYTATGSETSLSGTDDNGLTLSYTPNYEQVYLNGVLLTRGTDYTAASSSSITGLSALTNGDVINVLVLEATTVDNTYTQNQVDVLATDLRNEQVAINQFGADGSQLLNLPARVHPGEQLLKQAVWWIDSAHSSADGQEVANLGWGGSVLDAQLGSAVGADSNDPKFLAWEGENYVYLPGVDNNYLSVPDEAALDITGDIDLRVKVALDDWTPGSFTTFLAKREANSSEISYIFAIRTDGELSLSVSSTGTGVVDTSLTTKSTSAVSALDGDALWVRVTLDVDNGAGGKTYRYYTSDDGVSWVQLGSDVVTSGTVSIYNSTASVEVGSQQGGSFPLAGKVYRAQVFDGIDGTKVLDVDTSLVDSGSDTSFTALTGQTVTINRSTSGRKSVAVTHPLWLFGTDDYMEVSDNDLLDFTTGDSFTVVGVYRIYQSLNSNPHLLSKANAGAVSANTNLGYRVMLKTTSGLFPRLYVSDGTNSAGNVNGDTFAYGDLQVQSFPTTATGSIDNSFALRVGRQGSFYADMEFIAAAVFRRALTSGEIATLNTYFQGRVA